MKETLNGSDYIYIYDFDVRNGDTDRTITCIIGTIGSTPDIQLTDGKVNLLGNLEITHIDDAGEQNVTIKNPDIDGWIRLSNSGLSRLGVTTTGVDVYGVLIATGNADIGGNVECVAFTERSNAKLRETLMSHEINTKDRLAAVNYINPKTYNFVVMMKTERVISVL